MKLSDWLLEAGMLAVIIAFAFLPGESFAGVYKCTEEGKVVYSDKPCEYAAKKVKLNDNTTDGSDAQREIARQRAQEEAAVQRRMQQNQAAPAAQTAGPSAETQRLMDECARNIKQSCKAVKAMSGELADRVSTDQR